MAGIVRCWRDRSLNVAGRRVELAFFGGTFTAMPAAVQDAYLVAGERLRRDGLIHGMRLSTRPDAVGDAVGRRLGRFGVDLVELGVQSLDDRVLALNHRGYGAAEAVTAVRRLTASGFAVGMQLMVGMPGQDRGSFLATVERTVALRPAGIRLYPALVLAGSPWAAVWRRHGEPRPLELDAAVTWCAAAVDLCVRAGVPVWRCGLQATDGLAAAENVLAGPYHPAFGDLVKSFRFREKVIDILGKDVLQGFARFAGEGPATVEFGLHPGDVSAFVGHRRANLDCYRRRFPAVAVRWTADVRCCPGTLTWRLAAG